MTQYGYRLRSGDLVYGGYETNEEAIRAAAVAIRATGRALDGTVVTVGAVDGAAFAGRPQWIRMIAQIEGGISWLEVM